MASRRNQILKTCRSICVKVACVVFGWWVETALSNTLKNIFLGEPQVVEKETVDHKHEVPSESASLTAMLGLGTFTISLFLSALVSTSSRCFPDHISELVVGGCSLIPAWAWKGFINDSITALNLSGPIEDSVFALCAALAGGFLDVTAELSMRFLEKDGFLYKALTPMTTCFILGVAYAINNVLYACLPVLVDDTVASQRLLANGVYAILMTLFVIFVLSKLNAHIEEHVKQDTAMLPLGMDMGILFILKSEAFILGWAWQGVVDTILAMEAVSPFWSAIIITLVNIVVLSLLSIANVSGSRVDMAVTAAALNVAWAWMAFCAASTGGKVLPLYALWAIGLFEATVGMVFALLAEFFLYKLQSPEEEDLPLVAGARQSGQPQCAGGILKMCQRSPQAVAASK